MPTTAPGPPTNVKGVMTGETTALVSWTAPTSVGSGLTGYIVTATSSNNGTTKTVTISSSSTLDANVTGLTKGKKYTFSVVSTGVSNSTASIPTETKIAGGNVTTPTRASGTIVTASVTKATGSDTIALTASKNIIQFQDQAVQNSTTFTKFRSHSEYLSYLKGKTVLGFS
jgi:hypothetical protein